MYGAHIVIFNRLGLIKQNVWSRDLFLWIIFRKIGRFWTWINNAKLFIFMIFYTLSIFFQNSVTTKYAKFCAMNLKINLKCSTILVLQLDILELRYLHVLFFSNTHIKRLEFEFIIMKSIWGQYDVILMKRQPFSLYIRTF